MEEWMKEGLLKKNLCRKSQVVHPGLSLPVMVTGRRVVAVLIFSATLSFVAIVHVLRNKASGIWPHRRAERCYEYRESTMFVYTSQRGSIAFL